MVVEIREGRGDLARSSKEKNTRLKAALDR
jgi:hypothetical protein